MEQRTDAHFPRLRFGLVFLPLAPLQQTIEVGRLVVVFSLAVGTVIEAAIGRYQGKQTGENSLFRTLHDALDEGDVVLADRYFSGWFDLALLAQRGVHQRPSGTRHCWAPSPVRS